MTDTEDQPMDELAKRRRAAALAHVTACMCYEMADKIIAMGVLGMSFSDVAEAVWANLRSRDQEVTEQTSFGEFFGFVLETATSMFMRIEGETDADRLKRQASVFSQAAGVAAPEFTTVASKLERAVDSIGMVNKPTTRMRNTIRRLLGDTPARDGQTPAVACAVCLHGGPTINGSLSETEDGGLRMLSPEGRDSAGNPRFVEQFFGFEDVLVIGVIRPVTVDTIRIIQS